MIHIKINLAPGIFNCGKTLSWVQQLSENRSQKFKIVYCE